MFWCPVVILSMHAYGRFRVEPLAPVFTFETRPEQVLLTFSRLSVVNRVIPAQCEGALCSSFYSTSQTAVENSEWSGCNGCCVTRQAGWDHPQKALLDASRSIQPQRYLPTRPSGKLQWKRWLPGIIFSAAMRGKSKIRACRMQLIQYLKLP